MTTESNQQAPRASMCQQLFELYRLRAEEFERSFYSFRTVEWQVAFQVYAGYAAVTAGFFALKAEKGFGIGPISLAVFSLLLLSLIFFVGLFWQWQILRRLHYSQKMKFVYLDKLHEVVGAQLPLPDGLRRPSFPRWWAFVPMQILNVAAFFAIGVAILNATPWCVCR